MLAVAPICEGPLVRPYYQAIAERLYSGVAALRVEFVFHSAIIDAPLQGRRAAAGTRKIHCLKHYY